MFWTNGDFSDPTKIEFDTGLGGLFSPGEKGPDDLGTDVISSSWKDRCGVHVSVGYD